MLAAASDLQEQLLWTCSSTRSPCVVSVVAYRQRCLQAHRTVREFELLILVLSWKEWGWLFDGSSVLASSLSHVHVVRLCHVHLFGLSLSLACQLPSYFAAALLGFMRCLHGMVPVRCFFLQRRVQCPYMHYWYWRDSAVVLSVECSASLMWPVAGSCILVVACTLHQDAAPCFASRNFSKIILV